MDAHMVRLPGAVDAALGGGDELACGAHGTPQRELYALAHQAGGWTEAHTRSKLQSAVFRTAHQAARGERVHYAGIEVDPRYRFRNQTIIDLLDITLDEERAMRTIISDEERRRRDQARKNPVSLRNLRATIYDVDGGYVIENGERVAFFRFN